MLDHVLTILLLIIVPARALWRSRSNAVTFEPKTTRYLTTIAMVAGLLCLLAVDWAFAGRTLGALGLAPLVTPPAIVGLCLLAVLLFALWRATGQKSARMHTDAGGAEWALMPDTMTEKRLFLLFALAAGVGWEVLYRGFLLYYLEPRVGIPTAVVLAALAYGLAHGFKSMKQISASLVAAMAFTLAYAITGSLWWLILIHIWLPLTGLRARPTRQA